MRNRIVMVGFMVTVLAACGSSPSTKDGVSDGAPGSGGTVGAGGADAGVIAGATGTGGTTATGGTTGAGGTTGSGDAAATPAINTFTGSGSMTMASSQSFSRIQRRMLLSPCPASPVKSDEPL